MKLRFNFVISLILSLALFGVSGSIYAADQASVGPKTFIELAKKTLPSVVNISTVSTVKSPYARGGDDDLFRRFFEEFFRNQGRPNDEQGPPPSGPRKPSRDPKMISLGTGFIIDSSGLILTNNHVIAGADEIKIQFTEDDDEMPTDGELVGKDAELDVALIRVKTKRALIPMVLGDSEKVEVGEWVVAVGNPFGQGHTVTHGIISAKGRRAPDFVLANYLQTDAPINPGNSGGPLINLKGEVIGINNAIDQRAQGIGFAIPINLVTKVLPQLKANGRVERGYIGIEISELTPELAKQLEIKDTAIRAPFITNVVPGQPADKAGLEAYDVVTEVDGRKIRNYQDLIQTVTNLSVGAKTTIKVLRKGAEKTFTVSVAPRPSSEPADQKPSGPKPEKSSIDLGMALSNVTPQLASEIGFPEKTKGVVVMSTAYDGFADRAGILRGDVIVEVDRHKVASVQEFNQTVKDKKKSYLVRVMRMTQKGPAYLVLVLDLKG